VDFHTVSLLHPLVAALRGVYGLTQGAGRWLRFGHGLS